MQSVIEKNCRTCGLNPVEVGQIGEKLLQFQRYRTFPRGYFCIALYCTVPYERDVNNLCKHSVDECQFNQRDQMRGSFVYAWTRETLPLSADWDWHLTFHDSFERVKKKDDGDAPYNSTCTETAHQYQQRRLVDITVWICLHAIWRTVASAAK